MLTTLFVYVGCLLVVMVCLWAGAWGTAYRTYFHRLRKIIAVVQRRRWVLRFKEAHEIPYLNQERVKTLSHEFNDLGFEFAADMVALAHPVPVRAKHPPAPIAAPFGAAPEMTSATPQTVMFLRIFLARENRSFSVLCVVITVDRQKEKWQSDWQCVFTSLADAADAGESWSYDTSNRAASEAEMAYSSFLRRPRVLKTYRPGASVDELWAIHRSRRVPIAEAANLTWKCPSKDSAEENLSASLALTEHRWNSMTPLKMAWLLRRHKTEPDKMEWLGELRGKL